MTKRHTCLISSLLLMNAVNLMAQSDTLSIHISEADEPMMIGLYQPTWQSFAENYQVPQWFRDAKFGIWAHWGPQCVEGTGDWMGRKLYEEGEKAYDYHRAHYGHPSQVGFKDVLPLMKAENWNPDSLVAFYKEVGARYFVAMANHHDNFDMWDSKYQEWNSANIGPKRDVLAEWKSAADKAGLPFGVSIHADHAWFWYEPAQGADRSGDMVGVPYDGNITAGDGDGKWWQGYDPQHLYRQRHPLSTLNDGATFDDQWNWQGGACQPSEEFATNIYNRTVNLINCFNPDFIYFDSTGLPLWPVSDAGLKIGAHFYNHNMATHNGENQAVMTGKILTDEQKQGMVWDVERGAPNEIIPEPWEACTCIGGWHYNQGIYDSNGYKSAATVVKMLVDIVSKNGNMLLSVPLRADGTFDDKEAVVLHGIAEWMKINSECIYATRPWTIFGEGPVADSVIEIKAQGFNEGAYAKAGSDEIRFTQTDDYLYATALAWPENASIIKIKSLGKGSALYPNKIKSVELVGYGKVKFSRTAAGLIVKLPSPTNAIAPVLRIKK